MKPKAILLDLDGTLLTSEKVISSRTKQVLMEAQKQGIRIVLASGRPTKGMEHIAGELEMSSYQGLIVSYNGARVVECETGNEVFSQPLPIQYTKAVLEHLQGFNVKTMIDRDDYLYVEDVYDNVIRFEGAKLNIIEYEARGVGFKLCEVDDLADFVDFPVHKILVAGDPDYLQTHYQQLQEPFQGQVTGAFSAPFYFEFTDKNINKGNAVEQTLSSLGIAAEDTIAFGDGQNDYTMLTYAGKGVAMENAEEALKSIADEVTLSNEEDGIAVVLEKLIDKSCMKKS
ncbi:Cof-type HAD-IIB family hydrolase [Oceanobacillus sp. CFH 90083]|uniref:Cof-type HAD-IIB family hydrolase n=1 Tax=Oceanobacillus sp. CFH 90083 TaxID=2592336 RepID=UPI00128D3258|nr:Cof-type HAD-IIB family hydrolase [Oceanobacillus sp. CFH 90083]